uniref:Uncharacterized protein n=1 Tax=Anopheles atroparvus TaxID=41427 RepID=A0A182JMD7_ANOAO
MEFMLGFHFLAPSGQGSSPVVSRAYRRIFPYTILDKKGSNAAVQMNLIAIDQSVGFFSRVHHRLGRRCRRGTVSELLLGGRFRMERTGGFWTPAARQRGRVCGGCTGCGALGDRAALAPAGSATVGGLRVLTVARVRAEAGVARVERLSAGSRWSPDARAPSVAERGELWQDVRVRHPAGAARSRASASAAAVRVGVREAPIVDEALVEDGLVVDVLRGIRRRYDRQVATVAVTVR